MYPTRYPTIELTNLSIVTVVKTLLEHKVDHDAILAAIAVMEQPQVLAVQGEYDGNVINTEFFDKIKGRNWT